MNNKIIEDLKKVVDFMIEHNDIEWDLTRIPYGKDVHIDIQTPVAVIHRSSNDEIHSVQIKKLRENLYIPKKWVFSTSDEAVYILWRQCPDTLEEIGFIVFLECVI